MLRSVSSTSPVKGARQLRICRLQLAVRLRPGQAESSAAYISCMYICMLYAYAYTYILCTVNIYKYVDSCIRVHASMCCKMMDSGSSSKFQATCIANLDEVSRASGREPLIKSSTCSFDHHSWHLANSRDAGNKRTC